MIGRLLLRGIFCLALGSSAAADYSRGMTAYESGRHFEAYHQFRSTAEAGEADSQYMLGRLYAEGRGVRQDFVKAHKWFDLAAAAGLDRAAAARADAAARMTAEEVARARALVDRWEPSATRWRVPDPFVFSIQSTQRVLNELGYEAGPEDGLMGGRTRDAISAYQRDSGLPETGEATEALFDHLRAALWMQDAPKMNSMPQIGRSTLTRTHSVGAAAMQRASPDVPEYTVRAAERPQPSGFALTARSALRFMRNIAQGFFDSPVGDAAQTGQTR